MAWDIDNCALIIEGFRGDLKNKMAKKTWLQKHWDEVVLYGGITLSLFLLFKSLGY